MSSAVLSLGSNLGDRQQFLKDCRLKIENQVGKILQCSSVRETVSWGFDSYNFLNQVIVIDTFLSPFQLLEQLQSIEKQLGRSTKTLPSTHPQYHDRTIDIDILYYDDLQIITDTLTIPHPKISERDFVLIPLRELGWKV